MIIKDWNDRDIEFEQSRGGVLAVVNYSDNHIRCDSEIWPHPAIVQKLYQSRQISAFELEAQQRLTEKLGFYCDLQSLNSEDAITWSLFGTLILGESSIRVSSLNWLLVRLDIDCPCDACEISLWRRALHPETKGMGGPELDFIIQGDKIVILGEVKWNSIEGRGQGIQKDRTQIELRKEFLSVYGKGIYGSQCLAIMVLQRHTNSSLCVDEDCDGVTTRTLYWKDMLKDIPHPKADELRRYYHWKRIGAFQNLVELD